MVFRVACRRWPRDPAARVFCYLDDVYCVGTVEALRAVAAAAPALYSARGLRLNGGKTKVWNPAGLQLTAHLVAAQVENLTCVGSLLGYVGQGDVDDLGDDPSRVQLAAEDTAPQAEAQLLAYLACLRRLHAAGLSAEDEVTLLRIFVNGAALHHARAHLLSEAWCRDYDGTVVTHVEGLLGQTLAEDTSAQSYLSQKHGGLEFQSMQDRRLGACVFFPGTRAFTKSCCEVGATTLRSFTDACPQTSHSV